MDITNQSVGSIQKTKTPTPANSMNDVAMWEYPPLSLLLTDKMSEDYSQNSTLRDLLMSAESRKLQPPTNIRLGFTMLKEPMIRDIALLRHILIIGGKDQERTNLINSVLVSFLFTTNPSEIRLVLIDPTKYLTKFNGIPHLLTPVISEPNRVLSSLRWAMTEMENRYKKFAEGSLLNIGGFNEKAGFRAMPNIIILIRNLDTFYSYAPDEMEDVLFRMKGAHNAGIHIIFEFSDLSQNVFKLLPDLNTSTKFVFSLPSLNNSMAIIGKSGAEKLFQGDMLVSTTDSIDAICVQTPIITDYEIQRVISFHKNTNIPINYTEK